MHPNRIAGSSRIQSGAIKLLYGLEKVIQIDVMMREDTEHLIEAFGINREKTIEPVTLVQFLLLKVEQMT
jgi:hypothetical protein